MSHIARQWKDASGVRNRRQCRGTIRSRYRSFTSTGHLITGGRWGCTATLLNDGTALITGGRDLEDVFGGGILTAEQFGPATGTFTASGVMTQFRYWHTAALLNNGKVLLTRGINGDSVQDTELFDPTTKFSHAGPMGSPRANRTATLLDDAPCSWSEDSLLPPQRHLRDRRCFRYRDELVHAYGPFGDRAISSHGYATEQWPGAHHRRAT